ncbi:MAG: hypothetical protein ACXVRN_15805, partial [Solirubrobacteraceae bacterium]
MFRCVARIAAAAVCAALLCVPAAQAQVQPYGTSDYGGFRNVLPPGTNGFDDAAQLVQFEATGARPAHSDDQLAMYSNLTTAAGSITPATVPDYYRRPAAFRRAAPRWTARSPRRQRSWQRTGTWRADPTREPDRAND